MPMWCLKKQDVLYVTKQDALSSKTTVARSNARGKLTVTDIEQAEIPPGKDELKLWDGVVSGLYLRLRLGGSRSGSIATAPTAAADRLQ